MEIPSRVLLFDVPQRFVKQTAIAYRWKEMALEEEEESKSFETPEDPAYAKHINLYKLYFHICKLLNTHRIRLSKLSNLCPNTLAPIA